MKIKIYKSEQLKGTISAPPSKSYTHRAIIMSSLADGKSIIKLPLLSDDTMSSINACMALGALIKINPSALEIRGSFPFKPNSDIIDVGNSGTTMRIITALCGYYPGKITITGDESIQKRPMGPLIKALKKLGVQIISKNENDCPPIIVKGPTLIGGETSIPGDVSSQYITGLLVSCPLAEKNSVINITTPLKSAPYIHITLECLDKYRIKVDHKSNLRKFVIQGNQEYKPINLTIPGDFSSSSFMLALAAITGSKITMTNLNIDTYQGDVQIIDILKQMGCEVQVNKVDNSITVVGPDKLNAIEINMGNIPDLFPVLCILGTFAHGITKLYGARHLRFKESDRIHALSNELTKKKKMVLK